MNIKEKLTKLLKNLVDEELIKSLEKYDFNSRHESYSVLREKFEELESEISDLKIGMEDFWTLTKSHKIDINSDDYLVKENYISGYGDMRMLNLLVALEKSSICAAYELLQFLTMVKKTKNHELKKKISKN